jgi:polar amino acid transport system substrate-binding protein
MLAKERIDYFITGYYPGLAYLIQARKEKEFRSLQPYVTASDNFIGVAKKSACVERLADIDRALAEMTRSGDLQRTLQAGLDTWRRSLTQIPRGGDGR